MSVQLTQGLKPDLKESVVTADSLVSVLPAGRQGATNDSLVSVLPAGRQGATNGSLVPGIPPGRQGATNDCVNKDMVSPLTQLEGYSLPGPPDLSGSETPGDLGIKKPVEPGWTLVEPKPGKKSFSSLFLG